MRFRFIALLVAVSPTLLAQTQPNSPVFKNYKPPPQPPMIVASDEIYQMAQAFVVARKANAGDVVAQNELALRYLFGKGVETDTAKAAFWWQRAADQNMLVARFNLAILYFHGWGVPWNPFEAYRQFHIAAEEDMPDAQLALGDLLTENLIVPRDWVKAYEWVKKAADAGYKPAKDALPEFAKNLPGASRDSSAVPKSAAPNSGGSGLVFIRFAEDTTSTHNERALLNEAFQSAGPEVRKALGLSRLLDSSATVDSASINAMRLAADAGSPEALTVLGRCYQRGVELPQDPVLAAEMYIRAIRFDSPQATELLWKLVQEKEFFPRLKARAAQDDPNAQFVWAGLVALRFDPILAQGGAYLTGSQAFNLLKKAGARNHVQALIETGLCYYAGRWVPQDQEKALEVWNQAAKLGSREAEIRATIVEMRIQKTAGKSDDAVAKLARWTDEGSVLAGVGLGYCYEAGLGVAPSKAIAARLYRAAAQRGSQDAYRALRRMHDEIRPEGKEFKLED